MLYLDNIITAATIFPFVAIALTIPVLIYHYRRSGALTFWRSLVIYSFIFYLLAAYCLIILPLPPKSVVAHLTTPRYNLVPFTFVREFINTTHWVWNQPATYLATLKQAATIQPLFNIVLTIPFGVYLRYFFRTSFKQTLLLSFGLTLFFELTQLSGLYGIYPRPYRLFDVDDLLLNTGGGLIGFGLAPLLTYFLPTRDALDQAAYINGQKVGYLRRLLALGIDYCLLKLIGIIVTASWRLLKLPTFGNDVFYYCLENGLYFVLLPVLWHGQTPGKAILRLKITANNAVAWRIFSRQFLLFFIILPSFQLWRINIDALVASGQTHLDIYLLLGGLAALPPVLFTGNFLLSWLFKKPQLFYEKLTKTQEMSLIQPQATHPLKNN
ncbi:VanZ family protein [Latilactobacillus sakei]|uniref:VanZ family protein n=1 Tax=Latilactobacillus sakei TaxID=1599 RepID=UPI0031338C4A